MVSVLSFAKLVSYAAKNTADQKAYVH